jgi:hypothetical protein
MNLSRSCGGIALFLLVLFLSSSGDVRAQRLGCPKANQETKPDGFYVLYSCSDKNVYPVTGDCIGRDCICDSPDLVGPRLPSYKILQGDIKYGDCVAYVNTFPFPAGNNIDPCVNCTVDFRVAFVQCYRSGCLIATGQPCFIVAPAGKCFKNKAN